MSKVNQVFLGVLINILVSIGAILLISNLMGGSGIMGYLIGLNMTAIHISYFNVIKT